MARVALPGVIEHMMNLWRRELIPLPLVYIDFHKELATQALKAGQAEGKWWISGVPTMVRDTFGMDGMRLLQVQVWVPLLQQMRIVRWHDGNQEFFTKSPEESGTSPFDLHMKMALNPGKDWMAELVASRS